MRKIFVYLTVGMFLLLLIPMTVGMNTYQKPETKPIDLGWTFLRGIITKPNLFHGGNDVSFRAIYVHYKTHGFGVSQKGVLRGLQLITLPNDYIGIMNNHYVFAKFNGRMGTQIQ
jgi:hypothetical protein